MTHEPGLMERLADLEQVVVKQADRISTLEDELRMVRMLLTRTLQRSGPEAEAA